MKRAGVVRFGRVKIPYGVTHVARKTLEIAVHPDGHVAVKAPLKAKTAKVETKIKKRARWILRQQAFFARFTPRTPPRLYCPGETHLYLGRPYRLKVGKGKFDKVVLSHGVIRVEAVGEVTPAVIRAILQSWYRARAYRVFGEILDSLYPRMGLSKLFRPTIHVRRMVKRWGSLATSGVLTLNLDLVRAPRVCVEYVVAHELCHMHHPDHGKAFYRRLEKIMPDWEKRKHRLETALI